MEKLKTVFDNFMSNYTDSEEVFKTGNLERQVEILLKEGVFDHLLQQVRCPILYKYIHVILTN